MSKPKKLVPKNELHHWWPRALSQHWRDVDGLAFSLSCDGKLVHSKPQNYGAIRNDNNIYLSEQPSTWDESFEHTFGEADRKITVLVAWLNSLRPSTSVSVNAELEQRLSPLIVNDEEFTRVALVLASLIVRSPSFRNRVDSSIRALRDRFGLNDGSSDKTLIGLNIRLGQQTLSQAMNRGKFVVLRSLKREFIFGDGFFHNIRQVTNISTLSPRCLVPITPEIAIFYTSPISYRSYPRAFVMNLSDEEVEFVNDTIQIYARRFLFYRSQKPKTKEWFTCGEHLEFQYDKSEWTSSLEESICNTYFGDDDLFYP